MLHASAEAAARGTAFLLARQDEDGGWRDFDLPPGRADAWSTAYVVLALVATGQPAARVAAHRGGDLLERLRWPAGGWGYNGGCPVDADTTALACLALTALQRPIQSRDLAALARFQHPAGGFATYDFGAPSHAWRQPCPDVTATALRALAPHLRPSHERVSKGVHWLWQEAHAGRLQSYWWADDAYLDLELARLGQTLSAPMPVRTNCPPRAPSHTTFGLALRLSSAELEGLPFGNLSRELRRRQGGDGGWPAEPILRLPDPWRRIAASLHADTRRCFVTAASVTALLTLREPAAAP